MSVTCSRCGTPVEPEELVARPDDRGTACPACRALFRPAAEGRGARPGPEQGAPPGASASPGSRLYALAQAHPDLFATVLASPDDDLPRKVLADRLSEEGDSLGELITILVAAGREPPKGLTRHRAQELLIEHASALVPAGVTGAAFTRGFATDCEIDGQVADAYDPAWLLVERASLGHRSTNWLLLVGSLRNARELEEASLNDFLTLLDRPPRPRLERLAVRGAALESIAWPKIGEKLPSLRTLELEGLRLDLEALQQALTEVGPRLERLRFDAARLELRLARQLLVQLGSPVVLECTFGSSWVELSSSQVRRCHEESDPEHEARVQAQLRALGLTQVELLRPLAGLLNRAYKPELSGSLRLYPPLGPRRHPGGRMVPLGRAPR